MRTQLKTMRHFFAALFHTVAVCNDMQAKLNRYH